MKNPFSISITGLKKAYHFNISVVLYRSVLIGLALCLIIFATLGFLVPELYSKLDTKKTELSSQEEINSSLLLNNLNLLNQLSDTHTNFEEIYSLIEQININDTEKKLTNKTIFSPIKQTDKEKALLLRSVPNGYPIQKRTRISSHYGYRIHPVRQERHFHRGTDLTAGVGVPVHATADGVVKYSARRGGFGKTLILQHKYGFQTLYAHLNKHLVQKGASVEKGQVIALAGKTGVVTGPHLHYEIRFNNKSLDPRHFIRWNENTYTSIFKNTKTVPWQFLINITRLNHLKEKASSQMDVLSVENLN